MREAFTTFLTDLNAALPEEVRLSVVVPTPQGSGEQLDTGAYDLRSIGEVADFVKLVPERDQTVYRARMGEVMRYAVAQVPAQKIILILSPNSTFRVGDAGIGATSQVQALAIAANPQIVEGTATVAPGDDVTVIGRNVDSQSGASGIDFDEAALAVSFSFQQEGQNVQYWIENRFSAAFKLDLASQFQLGGVALENIAEDPNAASLWVPVQEYAESGAPTLLRPNAASFALEWRVDGAPVEGQTNPTFVWTAVPAGGEHTIALVVSDGDIRVGAELVAVVEAAAAPDDDDDEEEVGGTPTPEGDAAE
ncbi:MAG: hypothetical protein GEU28_00155 [Dehalococcoidia bacterium]|nr:hypothetical protein [Dehalococcoidia bacterium]